MPGRHDNREAQDGGHAALVEARYGKARHDDEQDDEDGAPTHAITARSLSAISSRQSPLVERNSKRALASCAMELTVVPPLMVPTFMSQKGGFHTG